MGLYRSSDAGTNIDWDLSPGNFLHLPGVAAIRGCEALSSIVPSTSNSACARGAGGRSGGSSGRSGGMGVRGGGTGVRGGGANGRCGGTGVRGGGASGRTAYLGATYPTIIAITARR